MTPIGNLYSIDDPAKLYETILRDVIHFQKKHGCQPSIVLLAYNKGGHYCSFQNWCLTFVLCYAIIIAGYTEMSSTNFTDRR
jgi:hypothetical protein